MILYGNVKNHFFIKRNHIFDPHAEQFGDLSKP